MIVVAKLVKNENSPYFVFLPIHIAHDFFSCKDRDFMTLHILLNNATTRSHNQHITADTAKSRAGSRLL